MFNWQSTLVVIIYVIIIKIQFMYNAVSIIKCQSATDQKILK